MLTWRKLSSWWWTEKQEAKPSRAFDLDLNSLLGCSIYHVHSHIICQSKSHDQAKQQWSGELSFSAEYEKIWMYIYSTLIHFTSMLHHQVPHKLIWQHNTFLFKKLCFLQISKHYCSLSIIWDDLRDFM